MNTAIIILSAIIAVLVLMVVFLLFKTTKTSNNFMVDAIEGLEGLWVTSDKFAVKAGIDGMIIYLGKPEDSPKQIPACIVIHADDKTLLYKKFVIDYKIIENKSTKKIKFKISIHDNVDDNDDDGDGINDVFPENILMKYSPFKSQLILYEMLDGKKYVYADLVKDNISSMDAL